MRPKPEIMKIEKIVLIVLLTTQLFVTSCRREYSIKNIEGATIAVSEEPKENIPVDIIEFVKRGEKSVDSIKSPVIGHALTTMTVEAPESSLMNFAADALREQAQRHTRQRIDVAITNKGGLRSEITEGAITFGDIYNVFPFENRLVVMTLNGEQVLRLFSEIAKEGGEPISGARMEIIGYPDNPRCGRVRIGGKEIPTDKEEQLKREYRIATSDYLAQGNDGLTTLAEGYNKKEYTITLRDLMIEYITRHHKRTKGVTANKDGRVKLIDPTDK